MSERLSTAEIAALRSLPRGGSPFEINGAIGADESFTGNMTHDRLAYDRRILLVTLRSALGVIANQQALVERLREKRPALEGAAGEFNAGWNDCRDLVLRTLNG